MIVELRFDPVESLEDFLKATIHFRFQVVESLVQIVESLVLGPLRDPDCSHKRNHDRQRDGHELLDSGVHQSTFYQPNPSVPEPKYLLRRL